MTQALPTSLKFGFQNLKRGLWGPAIGEGDRSIDRMPLIIERLAPAELDLLALNETRQYDRRMWPRSWRARLRTLARALGMQIAGVTPSIPRAPSALLYRRATVGKCHLWDTTHRELFKQGAGIGVFELPGLPRPLAVGAFHIAPTGRNNAQDEIDALACRLVRHSPLYMGAGDVNFPLAFAAPDFERMLPHNRALRMNDPDDPAAGPWMGVADRIDAQKLVDVPAALHRRSLAAGDAHTDYVRPTGNTDRIDTVLAAPPIAAGIVDFEYLKEHEGTASDHLGGVATFDPSKFDLADLQDYR